MIWDRFDICEAYYLYAMLYNENCQEINKIWNTLHKIKFKASILLCRPADLEYNCKQIFIQLVKSRVYNK